MTIKNLQEEHGYTMLELLVAIVIMMMMAVPLLQGFKLGLGTWQVSHERISAGERTFLVRQRLEEWFAAAYPLDRNRRPGYVLDPMFGTAEEVTFSAAVHPDEDKNELSRLTFRKNDEDVFQMGMKPDVGASDSALELVWHDLFENVASVSFSYMEGVDQHGAAIWLNQWAERADLPEAVMIVLEFEDENVKWTPIVARRQIDEWAFCVLSAISGKCSSGETAG